MSSDPSCKDGNARFTTVPLNWSKMLKIVFLGLEVFVSDNSYVFYCSRNARVTFIENPQLKIISFQNLIRWYLIHTRALPSLNGGRLKMTLTVPLKYLLDKVFTLYSLHCDQNY